MQEDGGVDCFCKLCARISCVPRDLGCSRETQICSRETRNRESLFAVAVLKNGEVVGHVPRVFVLHVLLALAARWVNPVA